MADDLRRLLSIFIDELHKDAGRRFAKGDGATGDEIQGIANDLSMLMARHPEEGK